MPSDSESESPTEDETLEGSSPKAAELYSKELRVDSVPFEMNTSHKTHPKNNVGNTSYNKWKTQNNHLYRQTNDEEMGEMKSSLGKKLESSPNKMLDYSDSGKVREKDSGHENGYDSLFRSRKARQVHFNRSLPLPASETNSEEHIRVRYSSPGQGSFRNRSHPETYSAQPERFYPPKDDYYGEHTCRYYGNQSFPSQSYMNGHRPPPPPVAENCHSYSCHSCCERPKEENNTKFKNVASKLKTNDRSLKNLYRIMWLQNEQLSLLQRQINQLTDEKLMSKESVKKKEKSRSRNTKLTMEKVSVGVMTSFLNVQSSLRERGAHKMPRVTSEEEGKSDDSESEEDFNAALSKLRDQTEESLHLKELEVPPRGGSPSPPGSLHLDIQDYSSDFEGSSDDGSDDESNTSNESGQQRIGWTFYDNFVGQVNSLLSNSQDTSRQFNVEGDVRNATLDQLKKFGVSFVDSDQKRVTFDPTYNTSSGRPDSDSSMHINALARKYLQTDHLGGGDREGANLSYASLKYLEKYRLIPGKSLPKDEFDERKSKRRLKGKPKEPKRKEEPSRRRRSEPKQNTKEPSKILDITAIKQQPKLLPKRVQSS